jgi:hypothetical protein
MVRAHLMYSVEVRCHVEDLAAVMSRMRQWLDDRRFEPDIFRHTVADESVTIRLQFKVARQTTAFAEAFSGQLL